jgi:hypothetical protein
LITEHFVQLLRSFPSIIIIKAFLVYLITEHITSIAEHIILRTEQIVRFQGKCIKSISLNNEQNVRLSRERFKIEKDSFSFCDMLMPNYQITNHYVNKTKYFLGTDVRYMPSTAAGTFHNVQIDDGSAAIHYCSGIQC